MKFELKSIKYLGALFILSLITSIDANAACSEAIEHSSVKANPKCAAGQKINAIEFASYGTPNGTCGGYSVNNACHSGKSLKVVKNRCVGKNSCAVAASNSIFGDPCQGVGKKLVIQYTCSGVQPSPTPTVTPLPTVPPLPTTTPRPTSTPIPTLTPINTPTPTAAPSITPPAAASFYIAPDSRGNIAGIPIGNDNNPGTIDRPFATLMKAWSVIQPGNLVYLRGGTYKFDYQQYLVNKNGTAVNPIRIWAYPGENPVLTAAPVWDQREHTQWYRGGIFFSGNYFHWKGLEITGFAQLNNGEGWIQSGFLARDANYNTFEGFNVHHNGHGFGLENNCTGNLVLNSDFHHNYDPYTHSGAGGSADGLAFTYVLAGTSNTIRGCRAWWNSDDGFDTFENSGQVLIEHSWAWNNGFLPGTMTPSGNGVGFKLGSVFLSGNQFHNTVLRTLKNNVAFNNRDWGFHTNEGDFRVNFYNNVAFQNQIGGFHSHAFNANHTYRNNIAFDNLEHQVAINPNSVSSHNSCGGPNAVGNDGNWAVTITASDFISVAPTGVDGPRKADGSLPDLPFLHLAPGSDLIDSGINVGTPFNGSAPDLGAFEK